MRRPFRDAGALLAIALLTGALLLFALLYQREAALRSGEELTSMLSRVVAEQTGRTVQSADQALRLGATRLDALRAAGTLDGASARTVLAEELRGLPFLRALWVLDAQGTVLFHSNGTSEGMSFADREYFQVHVRDPASGFHVGRVIRSRTTGQWMISVTRPVRSPGGSLRYVVVGSLEPPYFEQLWRGVDLGHTGAVALYHRSGQMLARTPEQEELRGGDFSHLPVLREYLPRAPEGSFLRESGIDGVKRLVAYRQLPAYPDLVVVVGSGHAEVLQPWRRFAALASTVWAVAVAIAVLLTLQLRRQARRREQTELRFRQLAHAMPQIVFVADERGAVSFVNRRWVEVTGRPTEEALGARWQQAVHPAEREEIVGKLAATIRSGEEMQVEHRLLHRDGSYRWQLLRAVPVRQPGEGRQWFGTATDIDALKRAQHRLHEQADQLHLAGRLTRMGYWRADLATQRVNLSSEAAAILDMAPDSEPLIPEVMAMFAPDSLERGVAALRRATVDGEAFDLEVEMVTPTGRHVWIRSIGEPVRDEQGRVVAVHGAQQDITLRVLMMEEIRRLNASLEERIAQRTAELARQEALFRALAEQAPLPIWTVDPQGKVTFLSRAWYELAGGAPPQWLGHEWARLLHPDDVLPVQQNWVRSASKGEAFAGTRRIRARDGTYHTTTYRAVPVRGEDGKVLFWVGVDTDITDITANEAALRLANRQLESFSYSVSHDLQSPLQRVGSYARLLQQELASLPQGAAQHYLARIQANADAMSELIRGLLALAHVSEVELIRTTVNLSDLAAEILQQLQAEQPHRQVQWHVQPGLAVVGDARLMRSVLENLIGNAWKFTSREALARIEVGGSRERGEYFVRDNGCGFDMDYADRLFGTFQRLHGSDEFPGTGIGLATVARAISRQGGRVWAQAAPGEGATFYFTLPAA